MTTASTVARRVHARVLACLALLCALASAAQAAPAMTWGGQSMTWYGGTSMVWGAPPPISTELTASHVATYLAQVTIVVVF